jgi:oleandomycin transport system ATP-binding protein
VDELKARVGGRTLQIRPADPAQLLAMAEALTDSGLTGLAGPQADPAEGLLHVSILSDEQLTAVIGLLGERGFGIANIGTHLPSLDEVFLAITGQKTHSDSDTTPEEVAA